MKFEYFAGEQRTKEWFDGRLGKPTASQLYRWKNYDKRKKEPTLLKGSLDYERELMFERTFKVPFSKFVSGAMDEGVFFETFAREQYARITKQEVVPVGMWFNEFFAASPDGGVGDEGLVEIKWLKDTNWTDVLATRVPYSGSGGDHWKQIQGQLFASKRKWCDYVAGNLNTKRLIIFRVLPDKEYFAQLEESLKLPLVAEPFDKKGVYDISEFLPEGVDLAALPKGGDEPLDGIDGF